MRLCPTYFFLQYTSLCNSRCLTCDLWKSTPETLSTDTVRRIGRFFDPVHCKEVFFTGGEPLLPPNAADVAIAVNEWKPGIVVTAATNALRPDIYLPKVRVMLDAGVRFIGIVSINGRPETHDMTRGCPGNYQKAVEMAHGLKEMGALGAINILAIPDITKPEDWGHSNKIANSLGVPCWSSPILRNNPWFGREDDGATIPTFNCHAGEVLAIRYNGDITACQEPRPDLIFGNLVDEELDAEKAIQIQKAVREQRCQPCGCCTAAFTHGHRCFS